jgi:hypothetical protein
MLRVDGPVLKWVFKVVMKKCMYLWNYLITYEGVSKSFWTGHLEWELQMVQLSASRCNRIAILWVSLVSFNAISLCGGSQWVFVVLVHFVIDSVQKLLDTPSYPSKMNVKGWLCTSSIEIWLSFISCWLYTWHCQCEPFAVRWDCIFRVTLLFIPQNLWCHDRENCILLSESIFSKTTVVSACNSNFW